MKESGRPEFSFIFSGLLFGLLLIIYVILFIVVYVIWRKINPDPIVYYNGLIILLGSTFVFSILTFLLLRARPDLELLKLIAFPSLVCFLFLGYSFVITIPSLLDRSISIYLIGTVASAGNEGYSVEKIQKVFEMGYINGTTAIQKRLDEQVASGNMTRSEDIFSITPRGMLVHKINLILAGLFNIPDTYIRPSHLHVSN